MQTQYSMPSNGKTELQRDILLTWYENPNSTNKEINPNSEEIFSEIENSNLFTLTHNDNEFVSLSPEDITNIESAEFRDAIEAGILFIQEADWVKMIQNVYLDRRQ